MPRPRSLSFVHTGRPHVMRSRPRSASTQPEQSDPWSRAGNRARGRMLEGAPLRVGPLSDAHEREARGIAGLSGGSAPTPLAPGLTQVDANGAGTVDADIAARIRGAQGGHALPRSVSAPLEGQLGASLGGVRAFTGLEAERLTQAVGARAFTLDDKIFYGKGTTPHDAKLTAEEATHSVQQSGKGRVKPSPKGVIQRNPPGLSGKDTTESKVRKKYWGKFDDVNYGQFKVMTPDSKLPLGTVGMGPCAGLIIAVKTDKGEWCAGLHHYGAGSGTLMKKFGELQKKVHAAAVPGYGDDIVEEYRYLIPGSETPAMRLEEYEEAGGKLNNNPGALTDSYGKGVQSIAVTMEKIWNWGSGGLDIKYWRVSKG